MDEVLTLGEVATRFGCKDWQVRRLFERGIMKPARRAGRVRVFGVGDLPRIEQALRTAGYIKKAAV